MNKIILGLILLLMAVGTMASPAPSPSYSIYCWTSTTTGLEYCFKVEDGVIHTTKTDKKKSSK